MAALVMLSFRRMRRLATVVLPRVLVVVIAAAVAGVPAPALAGLACPPDEPSCEAHWSQENHCGERGTVLSCACGSDQPVEPATSRANDPPVPVSPQGSRSAVKGPARGDAARHPARSRAHAYVDVPLPILHASLLI
jgi:hypothetical protein